MMKKNSAQNVNSIIRFVRDETRPGMGIRLHPSGTLREQLFRRTLKKNNYVHEKKGAKECKSVTFYLFRGGGMSSC